MFLITPGAALLSSDHPVIGGDLITRLTVDSDTSNNSLVKV